MKIKVRYTAEVEESELLWWLPNRGTVKFALARKAPNTGDGPYLREGAGSEFCREVEIVPEPVTIAPNLKAGIARFGLYTNNEFNFWMIAGTSKVGIRTEIMAALHGVERAQQCEAGINAVREEFFRQAGIKEACLAAREAELEVFCKRAVAGGAK